MADNIPLILEAHEYLKNRKFTESLRPENFCNSILNSNILKEKKSTRFIKI
jgi:hypothetical protein